MHSFYHLQPNLRQGLTQLAVEDNIVGIHHQHYPVPKIPPLTKGHTHVVTEHLFDSYVKAVVLNIPPLLLKVSGVAA